MPILYESPQPVQEKICISIPCFGIFRLSNNRENDSKAIAYCSLTNHHNLFRNFWSTLYPVQEFRLNNDTASPIKVYMEVLPATYRRLSV